MLRTADKRLAITEHVEHVFPGVPYLGLDDRGNGMTTPFSGWGPGPGFRGTLVGAAWPAANRALFVPFRVPTEVTVYKMVIGTGSAAGGNWDLGIYDQLGNMLASTGSTARTAQDANSASLTAAVTLAPGFYYLAAAADGTNNYAALNPSLQNCKLMGMRQMATAFPLPSTATFASVASNFLPWFGAIYSND